jgi:hypothetical protein
MNKNSGVRRSHFCGRVSLRRNVAFRSQNKYLFKTSSLIDERGVEGFFKHHPFMVGAFCLLNSDS